jgi:hypothetical protein
MKLVEALYPAASSISPRSSPKVSQMIPVMIETTNIAIIENTCVRAASTMQEWLVSEGQGEVRQLVSLSSY